MSVATVRVLDADAVSTALGWVEAVAAIRDYLLCGPDPADAPVRTIVELDHGQLLMMPAENADAAGVKIASVSPMNPEHGLPRIQGLYFLLDGRTHSPVAILDGAALTNLRTPAVSGVAIDHLSAADSQHLVVFGTGPQARGHIEVARALRPLRYVTVVGRDTGRAAKLAAWAASLGVTSRTVPAGRGGAQAVEDADIVVCATTASEPLFDGRRLKVGACVVAVGSHEAERREVDGELVRRAAASGGLVVETRAVALREAGDIVMGLAEGACHEDDLMPLRDLVGAGRSRRPGGVTLFKSCGMGWEDLAIAEAVRIGTGRQR